MKNSQNRYHQTQQQINDRVDPFRDLDIIRGHYADSAYFQQAIGFHRGRLSLFCMGDEPRPIRSITVKAAVEWLIETEHRAENEEMGFEVGDAETMTKFYKLLLASIR